MNIRVLSLSKFAMRILLSLIIFPLVFLGQIKLGYEIGLFPLYMIPVSQLAWEFGWKGIMVGVALAVSLWLASSVFSGQIYSTELYRYYNGMIRGLIYLVTGIFILLFKRTLETHRHRMDAMRKMLNVCHGCGAMQGSDGRWIPMDQLLANSPSYNHECPTCSQIKGH